VSSPAAIAVISSSSSIASLLLRQGRGFTVRENFSRT
jgi:hypothetical protein